SSPVVPYTTLFRSLKHWRGTGRVRLPRSTTMDRWWATPKDLGECVRLSGAATAECRSWGFFPVETRAEQWTSTTAARLWAALLAGQARRRLFGRNKPVS